MYFLDAIDAIRAVETVLMRLGNSRSRSSREGVARCIAAEGYQVRFTGEQAGNGGCFGEEGVFFHFGEREKSGNPHG